MMYEIFLFIPHVPFPSPFAWLPIALPLALNTAYVRVNKCDWNTIGFGTGIYDNVSKLLVRLCKFCTWVNALSRSTMALNIGFILNILFFPLTTASVTCASTISPILNSCNFVGMYLLVLRSVHRARISAVEDLCTIFFRRCQPCFWSIALCSLPCGPSLVEIVAEALRWGPLPSGKSGLCRFPPHELFWNIYLCFP